MTDSTAPAHLPRSDVDLWSDEALADPFPVCRQLRDLGPVVWLDRLGIAAVPGFAGAQAVLGNWQTFTSATGIAVDAAVNTASAPSVLASDPPEHTEYRRPLARQLSSNQLSGDVAGIQRTADELVAGLVARGTFDAAADLARPFATAVVCDLLGMDEGDRARVPDLSEVAFHFVGPSGERLAEARAATAELFALAGELAQPGRLAAGTRGAELAGQGALAQIVMYLWAGVDTSTNALASLVHLLAQHPGQWDLLREDPSLAPGAFHEALRMHAPVRHFTRLATRAADVDGTEVPAGTRVLVMYGSACRDERHYTDPDRFDVTRPGDHLAFGWGVHHCVGANLADAEAVALLTALVAQVERVDPAAEPQWSTNNTIHGPRSVPVSVVPRRR